MRARASCEKARGSASETRQKAAFRARRRRCTPRDISWKAVYVNSIASMDRATQHRDLHTLLTQLRRERALQGDLGGASDVRLALLHCKVLSTRVLAYLPGLWTVVVNASAGTVERLVQAAAWGEGAAPRGAAVDCSGLVLMPGLCDAHVHVTACAADPADLTRLPESLVAVRAAATLESMAERGFTTVRDCGGADHGLAQAVEEGLVLGPRLLFTGHALSQTGGQGDFRGRGDECLACGAALRGIGRVCDGDAEVRRAARDELRKGAHCIQVMASGGASSPPDASSVQFSAGELRAVVEEAEAAGTYVCAHAYTARAAARAVREGARCIEHGTYAHRGEGSEDALGLLTLRGGFLVPTNVAHHATRMAGTGPGMPSAPGELEEAGAECMRQAHARGVRMAFGTDLLGSLHAWQSTEFEIRAKVLPSPSVVRSATGDQGPSAGMGGVELRTQTLVSLGMPGRARSHVRGAFHGERPARVRGGGLRRRCVGHGAACLSIWPQRVHGSAAAAARPQTSSSCPGTPWRTPPRWPSLPTSSLSSRAGGSW